MTKRPTKTDMKKVLAALKEQRKPWIDADSTPPEIVMDFDWLGFGGHPHIVWEEGPYDWTVYFPYGGVDPEFGFKIPDVSDQMPDGWYSEAMTGWAIGVYEA